MTSSDADNNTLLSTLARASVRVLGEHPLKVTGILLVLAFLVVPIKLLWPNLPFFANAILLFSWLGLFYGFALDFYKKTKYVHFLFAANLASGISVLALVQNAQLLPHPPHQFLLWALLCLPAAMYTRSSVLMNMAMLLALFWVYTETGTNNYAFMFPIFIAAAFYVFHFGERSSALFLIALFSTSIWLAFGLAYLLRGEDRLHLNIEIGPIALSISVFAYLLSAALQKNRTESKKIYGELLQRWVLRFYFFLLLIFSFSYPWRKLLMSNWQHEAVMFVIIGLSFFASLYLGKRLNKIKLVLFSHITLLVILVSVLFSKDINQAIYFQLFGNLAAMSAFVWLIREGRKSGNRLYLLIGSASIPFVLLMHTNPKLGAAFVGMVPVLLFAFGLLAITNYLEQKRKDRLAS